MEADIKTLLSAYSSIGQVEWIGIRPQRTKDVELKKEVLAIEGIGLKGDHYNSKHGSRQVTLIQSEHLAAVASYLNKNQIDPAVLRRNIVVMGLNLISLKGNQFEIGDALLEYSGECHPCSRMETNLGEGGYQAMRGHGGITARIIKTGIIKIGDGLIPKPKTPLS